MRALNLDDTSARTITTSSIFSLNFVPTLLGPPSPRVLRNLPTRRLGLRLNLGRFGLGPFGLRVRNLGLRLNLGCCDCKGWACGRISWEGRVGVRLGLRPTWLRLLLGWGPGGFSESRLCHLALCLPLPNLPGFHFLSYHNEWNLTTSIMNHRSKQPHGATAVFSTRPSDLFSLPWRADCSKGWPRLSAVCRLGLADDY